MPNVVDLFAGAGGLSLGAYRAGFAVAVAVELEKHAATTHRCNFPNTVLIEKDIRNVTAQDIINSSANAYREIVGVIGGPPCQGFSTIGHGKVDDDRNNLFHRFFEIVSEIKPAFFLAENVPGIMRDKYKSTRDKAFGLVPDYEILEPILVNASEYGAATSRTRYFFVGVKKDSQIKLSSEDFIEAKVDATEFTTVDDALEGIPIGLKYSEDQTGLAQIEKNYFDKRRKHKQNSFYYTRMTSLIPEHVGNKSFVQRYKKNQTTNGFLMTNHSPAVIERYQKLAYGERDRISKSQKLDPNSFCPTLRAGTGPEKGSFQAVRPIHHVEARVINPREAARLQGFPDWFELPDTIWHSFRQIGNSVSPIAAEAILKVIYDHLPKKFKA